MREQKDRIIVALDTPTLEECEELIQELQGVISYFKIGFELFTAHGWKAVEKVKKTGAKIFLDLKLHDIPNTVAKTAQVICDHDVDMFNVHALGGLEMMQRTREAVDQKSGTKKPVVIAVTILTSHSRESLNQDLRVEGNVQEQVSHLAALTARAGLDGIVCSSLEVSQLSPWRQGLEKSFVFVTPGIRPAGSDTGDQKRILTPKQAFAAGSDYLVIGRPITAADDPRKAALAIQTDLTLA